MSSTFWMGLMLGGVLGAVIAWLLASSRSRTTLEQERIQRSVAETRVMDLQKQMEGQRSLLAEAETRWKEAFENISSRALTHFQQGARTDLGERQAAIESLLKPLKESLQQYQSRLQQSESAQTQTLGQVRAQMESLMTLNQTLTRETAELRKVLSSNQARGRWGEETLRRVVEASGMSPHCDFQEQSVQNESKPDMIVQLPGDRRIIVDAKVPDLEWLGALDQTDDTKRRQALEAHASKLRTMIKQLSDRNYPTEFAHSLDCVVMFLPAESLFSAAMEGDPELLSWAASRKIILATPSSLIAILRAVSVSWQQYQATENAQDIVLAGMDLYERMSKFVEHLSKMGDQLEKTVQVYNDAVGSMERRVTPGLDRLKKLGAAKTDEEAITLEPVELIPRRPIASQKE